MPEWEPAKVDNAIKRVSKIEGKRKLPAYVWDWVDFDRGYNSDRVKPVYPVKVLGFAAVSLVSMDTVENARILSAPNPRKQISLAEAIDGPIRCLEVKLRGGRSKSEQFATILMAPDLPPAAIHFDDLHYTARKHDMDGDELRIIDLVTNEFGPEAVEFLDDDACGALMRAVQGADKSISNL